MKLLLLHPNFPAQFRHLAAQLGADPAHQVVYLTSRQQGQIPGVQKVRYTLSRQVSPSTHRYVQPLDGAVSVGQAAWRAARTLKQQGFEPDVVYTHVGWGPGLFMPDLFPAARYVGFFEWYYHAHGTDADFDPATPLNADDEARIRVKNALTLLELAQCHAGVVPTPWQRQQFPPEFQPKLRVCHDGIDTDLCQPCPGRKLVLPPPPVAPNLPSGQGFGAVSGKTAPGPSPALPPPTLPPQGLDLSEAREIVTYVARGMEPYRGFPQFMAAVAQLQQERPQCQVVVVGEDRVAYGMPLADGRTYRQQALAELPLDLTRLHFTGRLPHPQLRQVYQASAVHVYLTVPFVLSWSMLEAMACGCVVLGSRTPPVEEVIEDGVNGFLVEFGDRGGLVARLHDLLDRQADLGPIRQRARETVVERYSLGRLLPQQIEFLMSVAGQR